MTRFTKKNKEHIGLSPYALVFRGQKKTETTQLRVMDFDIDNVREVQVKTAKELDALRKSKTLSWLNVDGLDNSQLMEDISTIYKIDNNILSDVMNPAVRPKIQVFDKGIFLTLKMIQYQDVDKNFLVENLSLIISENALLSFQEQPGNVFDPVRERIRKHKNKIRTSGSDYLAFALLDIVVDNYIYVIGLLGDKIELLEEEFSIEPKKELLESINSYKRDLNFLRRHINPAKEMIINLAKIESELIQDDNRVHFKELLDNINEATELSESYREILYDQLSIYHSTMSTKLNEIMRVLTVFSVVFIPLTFLVGVYGTNFVYLPEKDWHYGYFAMWAVMVIVTIIMLWFFKRKKWF